MSDHLVVIVVLMSLATYGTRAPLLVWLGRRRLPGWLQRCLAVMPVAILVALATPPVLLEHGRFAGVLRPELLGVVLVAWIARRTRNLLIPVVAAVVTVALLRGAIRLLA
jgi:branched-subunit amino acid transport protein